MLSDRTLSAHLLKETPRRLAPTDISQFINLDQCRRFLRLRLLERAGSEFLAEYGVHRQQIPPLLARSGVEFERAVVAEIAKQFATIDCASATGGRPSRELQNELVVARARGVRFGETLILFQPRVEARLGDWLIRGDIDVLKLWRDRDGLLHVMIADIKSSPKAKVEHRLQVAFYHDVLVELFAAHGVVYAPIEMGILFQGPRHVQEYDDAIVVQHEDAERTFGVTLAALDRPIDPESYLGSVRELVTGDQSTAQQITTMEFEAIPFHLTYKCDWCPFNEFCMKWSAEHDDLSLVPHITETEKMALRRQGISTTTALAQLKDIKRTNITNRQEIELIPAAGKEELNRTLAATWPIGPRIDELVHRARRYRRSKTKNIDCVTYIPSKGYGSLPYCSADHNPNLVRVYIDAQHDYIQDRIYLLGALVVAAEHGVESPTRRRSIVRMTSAPPNLASEQQLFVEWINDVIRAIVELAAPDDQGKLKAPIHLIFYNRFDQRLLLEGLGRHTTTVFGATALYDFATQLAAYDSPVATFLIDDIAELKNYPMVCQSLQQVAAYLNFDWEPYRTLFRARLFDFWSKLPEGTRDDPDESRWYTGRARFDSQIPLEYVYGAWNQLGIVGGSENGANLALYRAMTPELIHGFQKRRLAAIEHIAHDFKGNARTEQTLFSLPDLANFEDRAPNLASALDEFVTIERHVWLGSWKKIRNAPPERRVLSGDTLTVRYVETDQTSEIAAKNRDHQQRQAVYEQRRAAYFAEQPDATRYKQTSDERAQTNWSHEGMLFRLRVDTTGWDCDLDEALMLSELGIGDRVVINRRWMVDGRLSVADQVPFSPTPKRLLYGMRADITDIVGERDAQGKMRSAIIELTMTGVRGGGSAFLFGSFEEPLIANQCYTLDPDPNSIIGSWQKKITDGLVNGSGNTLYQWLVSTTTDRVLWPSEAILGQQDFLAGLDLLSRNGQFVEFEQSKRDFLSQYGADRILLVQGPPGTGKSFTTAFAVLARIQGALAAGIPFRVLLSCKTHAATDVLLKNVRAAIDDLRKIRARFPDIFRRYFDERLLEIPLYRLRPRQPIDGVVSLRSKRSRQKDTPTPAEIVASDDWCVVAGTPGGIYSMINERWPKELFDHKFIECAVLDEASQMNLPEAIMATLPLTADGRMIVVGDPRQMPPIVHHDWIGESRRTFSEFKSYQSLYEALAHRTPSPPQIQFAESFRLHTDVAEFLRREIYRFDGINFHSHKTDTLPPIVTGNPFVDAVLAFDHPLVVVVHDEQESQVSNAFERALIAPVLETLAAAEGPNLDPRQGLGVVVPHRKQRAALQEEIPSLSIRDQTTNVVTLSAVDTVERFQGDERTVIVVDATESDREYLLTRQDFLLDPRRLTVAISRAREKMILVASRSVFTLFSADEETFASSQIWKNLLQYTCTVPLWSGTIEEHAVEVWGNAKHSR